MPIVFATQAAEIGVPQAEDDDRVGSRMATLIDIQVCCVRENVTSNNNQFGSIELGGENGMQLVCSNGCVRVCDIK